MPETSKKTKRRVTCLVCLAIFLLVVGSCGYGAWWAREAARAMSKHNTFTQVGITWRNYQDSHGHDMPRAARYPELPDDAPQCIALGEDLVPYEERVTRRANVCPDTSAKPLYSWRLMVHGYECGDYWADWRGDHPVVDFSQPWDSEIMTELREDPCYGPPYSRAVYGRPFSYPRDKHTRMVAIVGPGTAWGDGTTEPLSLPRGPLSARPEDDNTIPDDAIIIVESANSGIHWMEPRDFDIRTMPRTINAPDGSGISSDNRIGFCVLFADGDAWTISHDVPFEELEKFFTVNGAKQYDRNEVLGPYRRQ